MQRSLGGPTQRSSDLARTPEIYNWDQEHVLKLFYDWVGLESIENEAQISGAIYASGLPVPAVGEIVRINNRNGVIYQRITGPSMFRLGQRKPWNVPRYLRRAAELQIQIHSRSISAKLPSQRQILKRSIRQAVGLPGRLRSKRCRMRTSYVTATFGPEAS